MMKKNGFTLTDKVSQAFTLIELLVVISIIGILIAISVFGTAGAREASRDARRKSDLELVRSGLEMYRADCNTYPSSLDFSGTGSLVGSGTCPGTDTYISSIPTDPASPSKTYCYVKTTDGGYELYASLEQGTGSFTCSAGGCGTTCNYKVTNP